MKQPLLFEMAQKDAQALANLYHRPYYVVRGRISYWTVAAWPRSSGRKHQVLPEDGKVDLAYF